MLDALQALEVELVSIASRLLDGNSPGQMHVCPAFASRGGAMTFLAKLIELAVASPSLREALTHQGHPQIAEIGNRYFVWWPELKGSPLTLH